MRYWGRRARYAVPVAAVVAIGAAALVPAISGASAPPGLPAQSAQQLLADVAQAQAPQLSGSLTWTANLGLSDLSTLENDGGQSASDNGGGGFDPVALLSGSHEIDVWLDGTTAEHLALLEPPAEEVDLVRNGNQAWLWDSSTQAVTHLIGATGSGATGSGATGSGATEGGTAPAPPSPVLTPQQLAARLLSDLSPTTSVGTGDNLYVAGQPAYQLIVAPKAASGSTVDHIEIDIGATGTLSGVPLQVAIYASGQTGPALELGFTGTLNLGEPPASELTFTPPAGSQVVTHTLRATSGGFSGGKLQKIGTGWTTVISGTSASLAAEAQQGALSAGTTVVDLSSGQAHLFSTDLLNILVLADGQFYAGLVTPSVLEAAASSAAS